MHPCRQRTGTGGSGLVDVCNLVLLLSLNLLLPPPLLLRLAKGILLAAEAAGCNCVVCVSAVVVALCGDSLSYSVQDICILFER